MRPMTSGRGPFKPRGAGSNPAGGTFDPKVAGRIRQIVMVQDGNAGWRSDQIENASHLAARRQQNQHCVFAAAARAGGEDHGEAGAVDQRQRRQIEKDSI
jgi:hypothetical protein